MYDSEVFILIVYFKAIPKQFIFQVTLLRKKITNEKKKSRRTYQGEME